MSALRTPAYVGIAALRPPAGVNVPNLADPDVQAALAYVAQHRRPPRPLRLQVVTGGWALVDTESYLWWWALRHTGSGIARLPADWIDVASDDPSPGPAPQTEPELGASPRPAIHVEQLRVADLALDPAFQSRVGMDEGVVEHYADLYRDNVSLPPISVCRIGDALVVVDGFHRVEAAKRAGVEVIAAETTLADRQTAVLLAAGANATHGLQRSNADKQRAVWMLLDDPEWALRSSNWIAKKCGVSQPFVAKIRDSHSNGLNVETVATAHGHVRRRSRTAGEVPPEGDKGPATPAPPAESEVPPEPDTDAPPRSTAPDPAVDRPLGEAASAQLRLPGHGPGAAHSDSAPARPIEPSCLPSLDRAGTRVRSLLGTLVEQDSDLCTRWIADHVRAIRDLATRGGVSVTD